MTKNEIKIYQNEILWNLKLAAGKGELTLDMVNDAWRTIFGFVPFTHEKAAHHLEIEGKGPIIEGQGRIKAD